MSAPKQHGRGQASNIPHHITSLFFPTAFSQPLVQRELSLASKPALYPLTSRYETMTITSPRRMWTTLSLLLHG